MQSDGAGECSNNLAVPFPSAADLLPTEPARTASSSDVQLLNGSQRYRMDTNATVNGDYLDLAAPAGGISWGMYRFTGYVDEDDPYSVDLIFPAPLPEIFYLGMADFSRDKWEWHELGSAHGTSTTAGQSLILPTGSDYISANGYIFAVVLVYDGVSDTINSISLSSFIHDEAPVAVCTATPTKGNAALSVEFDLTGSLDKGGAGLMSYRFDWEGDGTVDVIALTQTYTHIYAECGAYKPVVYVVDGDNLMDSAQLSIVVSGWIHSWGTANNDIFYGITADDVGNVFAVGSYNSGISIKSGLLIAKFDRFGEPLWFKTWNTTDNDTLHAIWRCTDGTLLAAGTTYNAGAGSGDILIINFNTDGEILGAWTWGEAGYDNCQDIQVDASGNIYLTGATSSFGEIDGSNVLTVKLDSEMNFQWARSWGPNYPDYGKKIRLDLAGNAYVLVRSESFDYPRSECVLLKYDPDGALTWSRRYYMASHIGAVGMDLDWLGNSYIVGYDDSADDKLLLLKFDPDGALQMQKTWDAGYRAMGVDIVVTGGFMSPIILKIIGDSYSASSDKDILYLKMSSSGVPDIEKVLVSPGFQDSNCLALGYSGELLIGGWAQDDSGVWLDIPGTVADTTGTVTSAAAGTSFISNIDTVPVSITLTNAAGTLDTGAGGVWDAIAMGYFEDDM